jgi:hypothetical protein
MFASPSGERYAPFEPICQIQVSKDERGIPGFSRIQQERGGQAWAERFRNMTPAEQRKVIARCVAGAISYQARRAGKPAPIILEADFRALNGGGFELIPGTEKPLPVALGGDGRGLEAAGREVEPPDPDHVDIWAAAERIKAQLREIDPNPPLLTRVIRRPCPAGPSPVEAAAELNIDSPQSHPARGT